jgi:hypothetical protein
VVDKDPAKLAELTRILKVNRVGHGADEIVVTSLASPNDAEPQETGFTPAARTIADRPIAGKTSIATADVRQPRRWLG